MADPVVQIEGVGNVQFPASMSEDEIGQAAHRLYTGAAAKQISDNPPAVQVPAGTSPEFQNPLPTEKIPIAGAMAQPFGELAANLAYDPAFRKETGQYGAGSAAVAGGAVAAPAIGGAAAAIGNAASKAAPYVGPLMTRAALTEAIKQAKKLPVVGPIVSRIPYVEALPFLAPFKKP